MVFSIINTQWNVKDNYWKVESKKPLVLAMVPEFPQSKDFKAFAQFGPMIVKQILQQLEIEEIEIDKHVTAWKAVSRLSKLLYQTPPYVSDLEHHLECIDKTSKDVLKAFETGFPEHKGATKIHLINHLVTAVENIGPLSNFDAEQNESKNGAIRNMIANSNRQNNSRDVAIKMALFEGIQHFSSGGSWINKTNSMESPGIELRELFQEREMKEILGFKPKKGIPKVKTDHYYFYNDNRTRGICLVKSKREKTFEVFSLSPATQGEPYDSFDNQRLLLNTNEIIVVSENEMLHEANILHDCSDQCIATKAPVAFSHAQDNNFVLNSYSFSLNHTGRLDL
jgi:hypothetical protein